MFFPNIFWSAWLNTGICRICNRKLYFLNQIRLVNIRSDEIVDGNPKLTLGLIWTIILHFQVRLFGKNNNKAKKEKGCNLFVKKIIRMSLGVQVLIYRSIKLKKKILAKFSRCLESLGNPALLDICKNQLCTAMVGFIVLTG